MLEERLRSRDEQAARLQAELSGVSGEAARLREERVELQARVARLETALLKEREAAGEKLRLLSDAQAQLSDAFQAISAEALRNNNASFLHLAKATLEKFQETAKGDLELRQQAIGDLVRPLRESLDKVDQKIQEIETARAAAYGSLRST